MILAGIEMKYDSPAFRGIFDRQFPYLCNLASRILQDEDKAQDVAQEAFVKLWQKDSEEFESESSLRVYLYVLVKNACISELRKDKRQNSLSLENVISIPEKDFLNEILREETYQLLRGAIVELSPQAAKVVNLALKGYSNQEIAEELGVTLNTIKTVKKRAYKSLKEKLGNQYVVILLTQLIHFF